MSTDKVNGAQPPQYTPAQKEALNRLHTAASQFEGVFLNMLYTAMQETVGKETIFGEQDNTTQTFQSMLNEQRAQSVANTGAFGIGRVLEEQLKNSVLADAQRESKTHVTKEFEP